MVIKIALGIIVGILAVIMIIEFIVKDSGDRPISEFLLSIPTFIIGILILPLAAIADIWRKFGFGGIVLLLLIIGGIGGLIMAVTMKESLIPPNETDTSSYAENSMQQVLTTLSNPSPKCSTEGPITICDLSFNVTEKFNDSRNAYFEEGNEVICQEIYTEGLTDPIQIPGPVSISNTPQMCFSDWGYIWVDPTVEVSKYYGSMLRNDYDTNYYLPQQYNSCIWTYSDGNASVPYIEALDSTGPNHGYGVSAFCRAGGNTIDIYTYND